MLELTAVDNTIVEATKQLASQAGLTMDTIVRNEIVGGTNVLYCPKVATQLNSLYNGASFPEDYELRLFLPYLTSIVSTFQNATGLKKLIIKGNSTGAPIDFTYAFRCESLEVLDLSEFNAIVGVSTYMFNGASSLREIKGELDFSPCTAMNNTFAKCYALEALEIKENSLSISASFAQCSKLSAQSVQSIIDGLVTIETAQTLTLNSAITLTDEQKAQINSKGWTLVQ